MHTSPITLSLPVTLLNDWRLLCQLKQQQEPTQHASQCFMPARQPESDNKVAYFNGKTLVTTAAAPQNWCWILKDRGLTKSLMHVECDTWLCFGFDSAQENSCIDTLLGGFTVAQRLFINKRSTIYWWQSVNKGVPGKCG